MCVCVWYAAQWVSVRMRNWEAATYWTRLRKGRKEDEEERAVKIKKKKKMRTTKVGATQDMLCEVAEAWKKPWRDAPTTERRKDSCSEPHAAFAATFFFFVIRLPSMKRRVWAQCLLTVFFFFTLSRYSLTVDASRTAVSDIYLTLAEPKQQSPRASQAGWLTTLAS